MAACVLLAFLVTVSAVAQPLPAAAYGNMSAHPEINTHAVNSYLNRALFDEWLRDTRIDGIKQLGIAVTVPGLLQIKQEERRMTVAEWLAHGGMSADEPELPASFRHFYDPLSWNGVSHLTDHLDDVLEAVGTLGDALIQIAGYFMPTLDTKNPQINAVEWGLTHPDNPYSYVKAVEYYRTALARPVNLDADGVPLQGGAHYGMAWRAVGETMHMVADMTVPAHVRNDSHPDMDLRVTLIGDSDPYESTADVAVIRANAHHQPSPSINYDVSELADLMDAVARWTNANFFSSDTIPLIGSNKTANGEPAYPFPALKPAEGNYYYAQIDGDKTPILGTSLLRKFAVIDPRATDIPYGVIDWTVLQAQRRLLIPTAIEASSRVIDNFLPRLRAEYQVRQTAADEFVVSGQLQHNPTNVWPSPPEVNNGAFLRYRAKGSTETKTIWLPRDAHLSGNRIEHKFTANPGDIVSLQWDLGGYVITSQPKVLGGVELILRSHRLDTAVAYEEIDFDVIVTEVPADLKGVVLAWTMMEGGETTTITLPVERQEAYHQFQQAFERAGEHALTFRVLHPETGDALAELTRRAMIREIKVQIYPRRLTSRIGFAVEASCLPSEARYRYEWVFGDGETVADGKSVVGHTYRQPGTFDLTVRMHDKASGRLVATDSIKVEITGQEGDCELCGHAHGPLEYIKEAYRSLYRDGNRKQQCVMHVYWDTDWTKLREVAVFVDGLREGIAVQYYDGGALEFETPYVSGKRHGMRLEYNRAGKLVTEREFRDDKQDGFYASYNPETGRKTGEGPFVYFADTNQTLKHGYWTAWDQTTFNVSSQGNFDTGLKVGTWQYYHPDGKLDGEGPYRNDKRHGTWTHYTPGGHKSTGEFINGLRQGMWVEDDPQSGAGDYWKGEYVDGRKKGTWTLYFANGTVKQTRTW